MAIIIIIMVINRKFYSIGQVKVSSTYNYWRFCTAEIH